MTLELRAAKHRRENDQRQAELSASLEREYRLLEMYCDLCLRFAIAGCVVGAGLITALGRLP